MALPKNLKHPNEFTAKMTLLF